MFLDAATETKVSGSYGEGKAILKIDLSDVRQVSA